MHTAVVKLNALTNAVWTTAQNHDFFAVARLCFTLFFISGIHVSGIGCKFGGTSVNAFVHWMQIQTMTVCADFGFRHVQQSGHALVGKAFAFQTAQSGVIQVLQACRSQFGFFFNQVTQLSQEPRVDFADFEDFFQSHADAEGICHIQNALWARQADFTDDFRFVARAGIETCQACFQTTQSFVHRLLEGTAYGHDFAHGFHLCGQAVVCGWEFFKRKTRYFGHHIVD